MYYSYYLFGLSIDKPIWDWENWEKCIPLLEPIIRLSPETPLIKTNQRVSSHSSLRFGKMLWDEQSNKKWTTKYSKENGWLFFDTEIAFPARSYCHKNGTDSELFITVHNENLTGSQAPKIDQAISIHIWMHLIGKEKLIELEKYIYKIGALINWKIAGKIKRPASYESESGMGYTDSFWDGTFGVLAIGNEDFSANYKRYGIEKIKTDSF